MSEARRPNLSATSALWPLLIAAVLPMIAVSLGGLGGDHLTAYVLLAAPAAALFSVAMICWPRLTWFSILGWASIQYWLTDDLGLPQAANLVDDYLLLLITANWVIDSIRCNRPLRFFKWVGKPVTLFLAVGLLSMLLNGVRLTHGLFGIRQHLQGVLLFLAMANLPFDEKVRRRSVNFILLLAFAQIPFILWQWKSHGASLAVFSSSAGDYLHGTMGGINGNYVGYLSLMAMGLLLGLVRAGYGRTQWLLAGVMILAFPMVMSGARICIPIFGLFLFVLFAGKLWVPRYFIAFAMAGGVMAAGTWYYYAHFLADPDEVVSVRTNMVAESDPTNVGRLAYYPIAWDVLHKHAVSPWIGTGPATFFSLAGRRFHPPLAMAYNYRANEDAEMPASAIIAAGVEYGYLGLIAFYWILLNFALIARRMWRTDPDPYWQGMARGSLAMVLLFSITPLIANVWEPQQTTYYMWLLPGVFVARLTRR